MCSSDLGLGAREGPEAPSAAEIWSRMMRSAVGSRPRVAARDAAAAGGPRAANPGTAAVLAHSVAACLRRGRGLGEAERARVRAILAGEVARAAGRRQEGPGGAGPADRVGGGGRGTPPGAALPSPPASDLHSEGGSVVRIAPGEYVAGLPPSALEAVARSVSADGGGRWTAEGGSVGRARLSEAGNARGPGVHAAWAPDVCPICLEPLAGDGAPRAGTLQCGHRFHRPCINRWVQWRHRAPSGPRPGTCPVCKQLIVASAFGGLSGPL